MRKKQPKTGFTLLELLIVISIIGILVGVFGIAVGKWRARTRDSQRVADIKTLQQGLAFYFYQSENMGAYPVGDTYITGSDSVSAELVNSGAMSTVPADPINEGDYRYHYCSLQACTGEPDGIDYYIEYYLETNAISGKNKGQNFAGP